MRFRTPDHEPLEINLIPLIDVLLVILIFLAATTTFMRQQALRRPLRLSRFKRSNSAFTSQGALLLTLC